METILHITSQQAWADAQVLGRYEAPSLHSQGFIHCSTRGQVIDVANFLFKGQEDLVLLCIDSQLVSSEIRYECLHGGEDLFPHIYGSMNLDSVIEVLPFDSSKDGLFQLPKTLTNKDK